MFTPHQELLLKKPIWVALALLGMGAAAATHAQALRSASPNPTRSSSSPDDHRWRESLDAFAAADKLHAPATGGVLFVGSSSIRLWNDLEAQFEPVAVIKRGFGGSRMLDCSRYVNELVLPYEPREIVVYAGDNDLAEGRTPQQVAQSFADFVARVRAALPETRIHYLSIKPSPLREALMEQAVETNRLIADFVAQGENLDYIDIYSRMLDAGGKPRPELFLEDRLHLNPDGYAIWKRTIAEHLQPLLQAPLAAAPGAR